MLKYLLLLLWWPCRVDTRVYDAEFDIEGLPVKAVERDSARESIINYAAPDGTGMNYRLPCSLEKHNQLVARFRRKLKLSANGEPASCA